MLPQIETLVGSPVTFPFFPALYYYAEDALRGDLQSPTTSKITVIAADGVRIVFEGDFTVAGGDVTGGTMTQFTVFAGSTKVVEGTGYDVDAAALFDALQTYETDSAPFQQLVFDQATKFKGSQYDDTLYGTEHNDKLVGRAGNDTLFGVFGDDIVKGGKGDDLLFSFGGMSKLWGGADDDLFAFLIDPMIPSAGIGKIKDFHVGEDLIGLETFDDSLTPGYLAKAQFHKGTEATKAGHLIIYDKASGKIYFDIDGNGIEAQFQFAKVTPGTKLGASDFYVGFELGIA